MGRPSLLWKAPFPKQGVLNCEKSGETTLGTSKRAWMHSFLFVLPALTSLQRGRNLPGISAKSTLSSLKLLSVSVLSQQQKWNYYTQLLVCLNKVHFFSFNQVTTKIRVLSYNTYSTVIPMETETHLSMCQLLVKHLHSDVC